MESYEEVKHKQFIPHQPHEPLCRWVKCWYKLDSSSTCHHNNNNAAICEISPEIKGVCYVMLVFRFFPRFTDSITVIELQN